MITREDLKGMTPEQVEAAYNAHELDTILGVDPHLVEVRERARTEQITLHDVRTLATAGEHDLINTAHADGRITTEGN